MIAELLASKYTYLLVALILGTGLYMMAANPNIVKKMIGLNMFQSAIFLFFISTGYVKGGSIPVLSNHGHSTVVHANPLPHVVVLTAIVVGVALTAVGMALAIRIHSTYGTLNERELLEVRKDGR